MSKRSQRERITSMRIRSALASAVTAASVVTAVAAPSLSPTAVAATAPTAKVSATSVTVGGTLKVSGATTVPSQKVVLQLWRAQRWETVATGTSSTTKAYSLAAPTWWLGARKVRVAAVDADGSAAYTANLAYTVKTSYTPAGTASQYDAPATYGSEDPHWDPCTPIRWKYNPAGQRYSTSLDDAKRAVMHISRATGLKFVYEGTTTEPGRNIMTAVNAETNMTIAWSTPAKTSVLGGSVVGYAERFYDTSKNSFTYGAIILDSTATTIRTGAYASGTGDWTQVLTHEIGHVMGLSHAPSNTQNLYDTLGSGNHRLGAGDLNGLRLKGASTAGCAVPD